MPMFRKSNRTYRYKPLRGAKKGNYVKAVARQVAKKVFKSSVEHKYLDTLFTQGDLTTTWQENSLTVVPVGDTDVSRDGDQISPTSLEIRGHARNVAGVFDYSTICRVVVFQWHPMTNIAVALINSDVMEGSTPSVADNCNQMYKVDTRQQFSILKDVTFTLDYSGGSSGHTFHWKIPLKRKMQYDGGNALGQYQQNQIRIAYICTMTGANKCQIGYRTRMRYIDA